MNPFCSVTAEMGQLFSNTFPQYLPYSSFCFVSSRQGQMCGGLYLRIPSWASSQDLKKFRSALLCRSLSTLCYTHCITSEVDQKLHSMDPFHWGRRADTLPRPGFQSTTVLHCLYWVEATLAQTHFTSVWHFTRIDDAGGLLLLPEVTCNATNSDSNLMEVFICT